ncbi:flagellar motor protein MotB [Heliophilum fasciatum]|uniref:Chemotaxis protein MotB n=1 Tax=Heliophilum fasciatum TaxID=35700 RepID=A0A4R2RPF5_9FIRM|nr:flagellar motor protein MotB [Heliophilum fasciatum]MCW2277636.1 chemotaxis protein MotB [Heliophilum fasciatum]TCP64984.1 chemotaxis protein MotB [Heliophilum fasciatum]
MGKKKQHHEEHPDETWLVPYADVLTLLLALFIVMFAVSQTDAQKFNQLKQTMESIFKGGTGVLSGASVMTSEVPNESGTDLQMIQSMRENEELQKMKEQMDQFAQDQNLDKQIKTEIYSEGLMVTIRDAALFASGRADINPEANRVLETIAKMLQTMPNEVRIGGHTDNLPIATAEFPSNWDLSAKRALNVMKVVLNSVQLDPVRFMAVGFSEYRPKASNDTEEGRAQNRRVEIFVVRRYPDPSNNVSANSPLTNSAVPKTTTPAGESVKFIEIGPAR